jgi:hypothetical protein
MVKSSTTQPTAMRSSMALAPGRICSIKENAGNSMPPVTGSCGVQV